MGIGIHRNFHHYKILFVAALTLVGVLILSMNVRANDRQIVTVFVDGEEMILPTTAETVGDLLERADVPVYENDLVEPSLETEISGESFNINVYRARPVTVIDGDLQYIVMSPYQSPKLIAESAGLDVYDEDEYEIERITDILATRSLGLRMTIDRAKAMKLNLYGETLSIRTQAETVAELIAEKNIVLAETDTIRPAPNTKLANLKAVNVMRNGTDVITVEEPIAFEEKTINDSSKEIGFREVQTPGQNGKKSVTYELKLVNGKEVSRKTIQTVVLEQPKEQVVRVGTKAPAYVGGSHEDWLRAAGIPEADWFYVDSIISRESNWSYTVYNYSGSGAYGLCQALPGDKMASAGADWRTNPITQLRWCHSYALGRYGSWANAYAFWNVNHWW